MPHAFGRRSTLDQSPARPPARPRSRNCGRHIWAGGRRALELHCHDVETFAVPGRSDARHCHSTASVAFDVDHHFDARQVSRKRSRFMQHLVARLAARPDWPSRSRPRCRSDLLDLFEPEQHLIFGQRLGAPAKTMTLQFLDDLTEPFVLHALGKQHRLSANRSRRRPSSPLCSRALRARMTENRLTHKTSDSPHYLVGVWPIEAHSYRHFWSRQWLPWSWPAARLRRCIPVNQRSPPNSLYAS